MKVYVDMDGTLVNFIGQVEKDQFFRKNGKVDWDKVIKKGSAFWNEMDWMPGAEAAFQKLLSDSKQKKYELYILSAVNFPTGVEGKNLWVKTHTELPLENVIIVPHGEDKAKYATKDSILIDDKEKCLNPFSEAGGKVIQFTDWISVLKIFNKIIDKCEENKTKTEYSKYWLTPEQIEDLRQDSIETAKYSEGKFSKILEEKLGYKKEE